MDSYELEKRIWSDTDFPVMGWHDCRIYAMAFIPESYEFRLDIDYIFKWVDPEEGEECFSFLVSPATMVFKNASDIKMDVEIGSYYELEISELRRELVGKTPNKKYDWFLFEVETNTGSVSLKSTSYEMYVRDLPKHVQRQTLSLAERGGICLNTT